MLVGPLDTPLRVEDSAEPGGLVRTCSDVTACNDKSGTESSEPSQHRPGLVERHGHRSPGRLDFSGILAITEFLLSLGRFRYSTVSRAFHVAVVPLFMTPGGDSFFRPSVICRWR